MFQVRLTSGWRAQLSHLAGASSVTYWSPSVRQRQYLALYRKSKSQVVYRAACVCLPGTTRDKSLVPTLWTGCRLELLLLVWFLSVFTQVVPSPIGTVINIALKRAACCRASYRFVCVWEIRGQVFGSHEIYRGISQFSPVHVASRFGKTATLSFHSLTS